MKAPNVSSGLMLSQTRLIGGQRSRRPLSIDFDKASVLLLLLGCGAIAKEQNWTSGKVVVPCVYREWEGGQVPDWAREPYDDFSVYQYQRTDPNAARYVPNQSTESGVYLRFIIDHYDDLPDVTIFVHARPHEENKYWLSW
jgi:hypothetical protein